MYIEPQTIITAGGVVTALAAIFTAIWGAFKFINRQKEQDKEIADNKAQNEKEHKELKEYFEKEIADVRERHNKDQDGIQGEQTLIVYGLLACLKGLAEQGCDGAVSEAIDKIEKHINKKAHRQE